MLVVLQCLFMPFRIINLRGGRTHEKTLTKACEEYFNQRWPAAEEVLMRQQQAKKGNTAVSADGVAEAGGYDRKQCTEDEDRVNKLHNDPKYENSESCQIGPHCGIDMHKHCALSDAKRLAVILSDLHKRSVGQ